MIFTSDNMISKIQNNLQYDFDTIQKWLQQNDLLLNNKKSYCMLFPTRSAALNKTNLSINFLDGTPLGRVEEYKYLGLWLDSQLSFKAHKHYCKEAKLQSKDVVSF